MQRPPAYSAVKVGGERLYKKARRGEEVEAEPRPVTVYRFEELWRDGDRAGLEIECSAGTYIRQLVADLGDAYCEELERTAIGHFKLEDADPERIVPLEEALELHAGVRARSPKTRAAWATGGRGATGDGALALPTPPDARRTLDRDRRAARRRPQADAWSSRR